MKKTEGQEKDLRTFLSETFSLYMKTYALHWNYEGPKFYGVHMLTEKQYTETAKAIDEIAERLRAMGNKAPVSLKQIMEDSDLKEYKNVTPGNGAIKELAASNRQLSALAKEVAKTAEEADDLYTHDMMVARSGVHDKYAWLLESFEA